MWYLWMCVLRVLVMSAWCRYSCLLMSMWLFVILCMSVSLCVFLRRERWSRGICFFIRVAEPGVYV